MLQGQALAAQLSGLQAQRRVLQRQMSSPQVAVRDVASRQLVRVESEIARVSVDLADVQGRLNVRQGQPGVNVPPNFSYNAPRERPVINSDTVAAISVTFILAVLMPISIGITRRLLRRNPKENTTAATDIIAPRLDRLEQAVDAIAIEVERIAEGQRFVTKVMTERPVAAPSRVVMESNDGSASALGEAKPFLALGAGPIEPIRVAERQAVRQSITPH